MEGIEAYQKRVESRVRGFDVKNELPTADANGKQCAPQIFERWVVPGVWEDTEGNPHIDVPKLLLIFELPDTPRDRKRVSQMAFKLLETVGAEAKNIVVQGA